MDATLKAKWLEALRSGDYEQCKGHLRADGGYCCLGVLAVTAGLTIGEEVSDEGMLGYDWFSRNVCEKYNELASMNDGGSPFSEIADYIEQNL